ncbi:TetR/AcrR family transcriptional regulator [Glaciecola petra]|uniref:TetR/AcrR family transcriptional regulator n=1 Tax=Glaciecola petra TaxID=3075602 RepID=A0ABU2ZTJ4_9ALTE|nr:TetR/AcrR family transcriptional regulator [Aestuariibacter sp. P117]MDT0595730.1 TetR/AcrR family transcriptional regulator [Aestuariibacter sp. P117]
MARIREFDEKLALNKAIELFWQKGYANSSMREMVSYTGVAHAGLYAAFGGKEALFIAALEKYQTGLFANLFAGVESPRADLKDIQKLFRFLISAPQDKHFRFGCFLVNSANEFLQPNEKASKKEMKSSGIKVATYPNINKLLQATFERKKQAFSKALKNAIEKSQIPKNTDVDAISAQCLTLYYGATTLIRSGLSDDTIKQSVEIFLKQLKASN